MNLVRRLTEREINREADTFYRGDPHSSQLLVQSIQVGPANREIRGYLPVAGASALAPQFQGALEAVVDISLLRYKGDKRKMKDPSGETRHYYVHPHFVAQIARTVIDYSRSDFEMAVVQAAALLHDGIEQPVTRQVRERKKMLLKEIPKRIFGPDDVTLFSTIYDSLLSQNIYAVTDRTNQKGLQEYLRSAKRVAKKHRFSKEEGVRFGDLYQDLLLALEDGVVRYEKERVHAETVSLQHELQRQIPEDTEERERLIGHVVRVVSSLTRLGGESYYETCSGLFAKGGILVDTVTDQQLAQVVKGSDILANNLDIDKRREANQGREYLPYPFRLFGASAATNHFIKQNSDNEGSLSLEGDAKKKDNATIKRKRVLGEKAREALSLDGYGLQGIIEGCGDTTEAARIVRHKLYKLSVVNKNADRKAQPYALSRIERLYKLAKTHIFLAHLSAATNEMNLPEFRRLRGRLVNISEAAAEDIVTEVVSTELRRRVFALEDVETILQDFEVYVNQGGIDKVTEDTGSGFEVFDGALDSRVRGNKQLLRRRFDSPSTILKAALGLQMLAHHYQQDPIFRLTGIGPKGITTKGRIEL